MTLNAGRGPHCTDRCRIEKRYMGSNLIDVAVTHVHGDRQWGGYDAHTLGLDCAHDDPERCPPRRDRATP